MTTLRQRFIDDLRLRNRSPRTIEVYVRAVARFAVHFGLSPELLGPDHIRAYQLHLIDHEHASWCRFNQTVCALRFLYRVTLARPDVLPMIPFGKRPKTVPAVLSRSEVQQLFASLKPGRNRMLYRLAYACGLRVSEVVAVRPTDIDGQRLVLLVRQGKGQKDRLVPLAPLLLQELRDYWRRYRPRTWLFPNKQQTNHVQAATVQRTFHALVQKLGWHKPVSMHTLRHSYATHLLEAGVDVVTLQRLLGHNDLSTTVRYLHVQADHAQRLASPLDGLLAMPAEAAPPVWLQPEAPDGEPA